MLLPIDPIVFTACVASYLVYHSLKILLQWADHQIRVHDLAMETMKLRQRHYAALAAKRETESV